MTATQNIILHRNLLFHAFDETCKELNAYILTRSTFLPYLINFIKRENIDGYRIRIRCHPNLIITDNEILEELVIDVDIDINSCTIDIYSPLAEIWDRQCYKVCNERTLYVEVVQHFNMVTGLFC